MCSEIYVELLDLWLENFVFFPKTDVKGIKNMRIFYFKIEYFLQNLNLSVIFDFKL